MTSISASHERFATAIDIDRGRVGADLAESQRLESGSNERGFGAVDMSGRDQPRVGDEEGSLRAELAHHCAETIDGSFAEDDAGGG